MSDSDQAEDPEYPNEVQLTLFEHLKELRSRLIKSILCVLVFFLIALGLSDYLFNFFMAVLPEDVPIKIFTAAGAIFIRIKISLYVGIFFSLPYISLQVFGFIRPALRIKEEKSIKMYLFGGFLLMLVAVIFTHSFLPDILQAMKDLGFEDAEHEANAEEYIKFILTVYLGFSILFQVPLIILITIAQDFVSADFYAKNRRWVIVILLILCAIFSPPNPESQIIIFIPLYALFEVAILLGRFISKKKCSD